MSLDLWGAPIAVSAESSVETWNRAWGEFNHFVGDPLATLAEANEQDDSFALGPLFCATYLRLGGLPADSNEIQQEHERARARARTDRERGHVAALDHLVAGDFTKAAHQWDEVAAAGTDYAAVRFAHDVYLHVGDAPGRLRSSQAASERWEHGHPGWNFVASQLSFALEETGAYEAAEALGLEALAADPMDLWALHSLAHVYESLNDSDAAIAMLDERQATWSTQDSLAVHVWWHLALRHFANGSHDEVLAIHDRQLDAATTPFRMCDLISLLWRLELVGVDVGDRWDVLAERFASHPAWHTAGFLDLHGALVYSRRPTHPAADRFFAGVADSHTAGDSENADIFRTVVRPLVDAIRSGGSAALQALEPHLHRVGGSIAQRDVVALTATHLSTKQADFSNAPEAT